MERLTKWEGHDPDGTPRAVLAKMDGNWNDNIQAALRKLAGWEDCEEALAALIEEESIHVERLPSVNDMHDRAEAARFRSLFCLEENGDHWGLMNEEILKEKEAMRQQLDDLRRKNDF